MIRPVTPADVQIVIDMGTAMHAESAFSHLSYDRDVCEALGQRVLTDPDFFAWIAEKDGEPTGFFLGHIGPYLFSRDLIATEYLWYVKPGHRGGTVSIRLMRAFIEWGKKRGAAEICMGVSTGPRMEAAVGPILERQGFMRQGAVYKLNVKEN